jgi:hypothetical protein
MLNRAMAFLLLKVMHRGIAPDEEFDEPRSATVIRGESL